MKNLIVFLASLNFVASEIRVCTYSVSEIVISDMAVTYSYSSSYGCGLFDWSRCYRRHYATHVVYSSHIIYREEQRCCPGYSGEINQCSPICTNCNEPRLCVAPFVCACPTDWSGDGCTGAPQSVNLIATGSDKLQMSWEPPPQSILDGFNTTLYIVAIENRTHHVDPLLSNLTVELDSLIPYTTYNCCVAANTTSGPSRLACAVQTTLEAAPADEPQNMTVTTLSSTTVHVQWNPPLTPNGVIVFYTIYVNGAPKLNVTAVAGVQSSTVDGFSPNQMLRITLSASTKMGEGPQTVPHTVTTHESVPGAVENVEVFARADYVLHVSWTPPLEPNGILTGYQVLVRNLIEATESLYTTPSDVHDLTISSGIFPYERYEVAVSASTAVGAGEPLKVIVYSLEGVPQSSPPNVTSSRSSATTASVEWDEMSWEDLRGWLVSYEVGYESVRSDQLCPASDSTYNETVSVDQEMYGVTGLDPGLQYCVWVSGRTSAGVGPFSHTIIQWFVNDVFTVLLERPNCTDWIAEDPGEILADLARDISRGIELSCGCKFPSDYIADGRLTCHNETLMYQGRIISTDDRDSADLLRYFEEWLSKVPRIIAKGEELKLVVSDTSDSPIETPISKPGEPTPVIEAEKQEGSSSGGIPIPILGGSVGGVTVLLIVVGAVIAVLVCRRKRSKTPSTTVTNHHTNPNTDKSNDRYTSTMTSKHELDYEMPQKNQESPKTEAPVDYEVPVDEEENIYEDPGDIVETVLGDTTLCNPTYEDTAAGVMEDGSDDVEIYCDIRDDPLYET